MQTRGNGARRRRRWAVAFFPILISAAALGGGSASFGSAAGLTPPGYHVHHGAHGETDVNLCADDVPAGYASCAARVRTEPAATAARPSPAGRPAPATPGVVGDNGGYTPAFLQSAYNAPSATKGAGQTVAVIDAYDSPTAATDLAAYRSHYGLAPCTAANGCFRKLDQNGGSSYPAANSSWAGEISIDVDMVSALCPNCAILLVEAQSASISDLGTAVNTAVALGANVVSSSWGGSEYAGELADNAAYFHHPGVTLVASSGDGGYGVEFPASSVDVTAVGGTHLLQGTNTGTRNATETAWNGAGSGCSAYVAKPLWQHDTGCARRTVVDVAAVADPSTGVWVYWSGVWRIFGGTSVAAPIVAAMYALAANPANPANPASQPPSFPYQGVAALNDVVSGNNGFCSGSYLCTAGVGYDGPTGLGTPNTAAAFSATAPPPPPPPPPPTVPSAPLDLSAGAGDASVSLTWSPPSSTGGLTVTYTVLRGTVSGGETVVASGLAATGYRDSQLTNAVKYFYVVKAANAVGPGPASNEVSATPAVASVLGPPVNLVAATSPRRGIVLTWSAPASNGGSPVTSYRVYRGVTSGGEAAYSAVSCSSPSCSYTDTATHRSTYYYEVAAVTAKGVGPVSNQASALSS